MVKKDELGPQLAIKTEREDSQRRGDNLDAQNEFGGCERSSSPYGINKVRYEPHTIGGELRG